MTATSPAAQCTPAHCTWGEVSAMYSSASFLVGLAVIAVAVVLLMSARNRGRR